MVYGSDTPLRENELHPKDINLRCHHGAGFSVQQQVSSWLPGLRHGRRHHKQLDLWCSMVKALARPLAQGGSQDRRRAPSPLGCLRQAAAVL